MKNRNRVVRSLCILAIALPATLSAQGIFFLHKSMTTPEKGLDSSFRVTIPGVVQLGLTRVVYRAESKDAAGIVEHENGLSTWIGAGDIRLYLHEIKITLDSNEDIELPDISAATQSALMSRFLCLINRPFVSKPLFMQSQRAENILEGVFEDAGLDPLSTTTKIAFFKAFSADEKALHQSTSEANAMLSDNSCPFPEHYYVELDRFETKEKEDQWRYKEVMGMDQHKVSPRVIQVDDNVSMAVISYMSKIRACTTGKYMQQSGYGNARVFSNQTEIFKRDYMQIDCGRGAIDYRFWIITAGLIFASGGGIYYFKTRA
jgi:hypothetical protein